MRIEYDEMCTLDTRHRDGEHLDFELNVGNLRTGSTEIQ
jgi:hypothetical protein